MVMEMPTVSITIEGMRHQIVQHLSTYNEDVERHVNSEVDRAVRDFNFRGHVDQVVEATLREAIKRAVEDYYFRGEGYRAIIAVVDEIVKKVSPGWQPPTRTEPA